MDPQLKQRLVGAAVLMALAVIMIPAFLDQDAPAPAPVVKRDMAPMPPADIPETLTPVDPGVMEEITSGMDATGDELAARLPSAAPTSPLLPPADAAATAESTAPAVAPAAADHAAPPPATVEASKVTDIPRDAPTAPAKPAPVVATSTPVASGDWIIQLGSFAREENAASLQTRVRNAGFDAFVTPLSSHGKRSYRVRVGGTRSREEAERLHARLSRELGFSGMVVRAE